MLANERVTLNDLESSLTNMPLELNGVARGIGIQLAQQGSVWTPPPTETPQLAQSVDVEGALNIATTIGTRSSPVLKFGIVEPFDPAGTNWASNPQCVSTGAAFTQAQASGNTQSTLVRDLIGYDYAMLQVNPGTNAGEGIASPVGAIPSPSGSITAGVWLKGANGGEAVKLSLVAGTTVTNNVSLTTNWTWFTVTATSSASPTFSVVGQGSVALAFYATGWSIVPGATLLNGFDGTTPGCQWQGLPHASQSVRPASGGPRLQAIMGDLEAQIKLLSLYGGTVRRMLPTQVGNQFRITYDVINATLSWDDTEYNLAGVTQGTISFVCEPYGRGPEMTTITDDFNPLIQGNYVTDSGNFNTFTWGATGLAGATSLTNFNRFLYNGEYPFYSGEVQATFTPGATINGFRGGTILKRQDAMNYLEGYVIDNGTSSFLRVDKIVNNTRTTELTATLGSRIINGTAFTLRTRIQRQNNADNVYIEYFAATSTPAVTGTPTNTLGPYVVTDPVLASETPGLAGISFTPETAGAAVTNLIISPYLARERTLPVLRFGLAGVPGTAPGLGRMDIPEISNNAQLWGVWGQRHDRLSAQATTNDLFYEAEALTPVNGAAVTGLSGASNGNVVKLSAPPAGQFVSMLATPITGIGNMTHSGNYNVWARVFSTTTTPQFQLQWGVGGLSVPTVNPAATPSTINAFCLVNLGTIQVPAASIGTGDWLGIVQANCASASQDAQIDCLFFQPLDDGGATMNAIAITSPANVVSTTLGATTGVDNSATGSVAWSNPANITAPDTVCATATSSSSVTTHYLVASEFGFSIPSGATIVGIQASILRFLSGSKPLGTVRDNHVYIVKGGTIETAQDRAVASTWFSNSDTTQTYGSSVDLWGQTWAASDINATNFGLALSASLLATASLTANVDYIALTVFYTIGTAFAVPADALIYAGQSAEISSRYAQRSDPTGLIFGQISSYQGAYMKVPTPAFYDGVDNVFVKLSRNLPTGADAAIDDQQAQVSITPRYAQIPNL